MARISISKVLQSKRRLKLVTLVSFLILAIVSVQLLVTNNAKRSVAADSCNAAGLCTVNTLDHIPAIFENKDVVIESGATVYADKVRVWQDTDAGAAGHTKGDECSKEKLRAYWPLDEQYNDTAFENKVEPEAREYEEYWTRSAGKFGNGKRMVPVGLTNTKGFYNFTDSLAISLWVKREEIIGSSPNIVWFQDNSMGWQIKYDNNKISFRINTNSVSGYDVVLTSSVDTTLNTWHHVFATYNKNGNAQLFLDNSSWSAAAPGPIVYDNNASLAFGYWTYSGNVFLDDVRIYDRVPTDDERLAAQSGPYVPDRVNETQCDSKRHFKSLTVRGTLTHSGVTVYDMLGEDTDNDTSLADETTGQARWKKVDFEIDNDVVVERGGEINVSKKGYPPGILGYQHGNGFGPGGGCGITDDAHDNGAGHAESADGGNHVGYGAKAYNDSSTQDTPRLLSCRNETAYDYDQNNFDFGSGGGAAKDEAIPFAQGGAGGGRIRLTVTGKLKISNFIGMGAPQISGIYANGEDYRNIQNPVSTNEGAMPGSGSGGNVIITAADFNLYIGGTDPAHEVANYNPEYLWGESSAKGGKAIYYKASLRDSEISEHAAGDGELFIHGDFGRHGIYANGGNNFKLDANLITVIGGAGGGGVIIIRGPVSTSLSGVTIKKTLEAVNRPSTAAPVNANFNPYALQDNDKIRVKLEVSGLTAGQTYTISDDFLNNSPGLKSCKNPSAISPGIPTAVPGPSSITWGITPLGATETLSYECIVQ